MEWLLKKMSPKHFGYFSLSHELTRAAEKLCSWNIWRSNIHLKGERKRPHIRKMDGKEISSTSCLVEICWLCLLIHPCLSVDFRHIILWSLGVPWLPIAVFVHFYYTVGGKLGHGCHFCFAHWCRWRTDWFYIELLKRCYSFSQTGFDLHSVIPWWHRKHGTLDRRIGIYIWLLLSAHSQTLKKFAQTHAHTRCKKKQIYYLTFCRRIHSHYEVP